MGQWLRICLPMQGAWIQSLVGELRSHMPCGVARKGALSLLGGGCVLKGVI